MRRPLRLRSLRFVQSKGKRGELTKRVSFDSESFGRAQDSTLPFPRSDAPPRRIPPIGRISKPFSGGGQRYLESTAPPVPRSNAPPRRTPPIGRISKPFSGGEPRETESKAPPAPHFSEQSTSRLILFPGVDILSDLTSDQLNALIFQYLQESGFPHTTFNFENEAHLKDVPIDKSKIQKGALFSFVRKGLRYTQLKANMHASDGHCFECYPLDPLDMITNNLHKLAITIRNTKENAKSRRNIDHGRSIDHSAADQEQERNKQKIGKNKEHGKDIKMQQRSLELEDQSKVDLHEGDLEHSNLQQQSPLNSQEPTQIQDMAHYNPLAHLERKGIEKTFMLVRGAFSTDVVLAGVGILLRDHSLKCALAMPVRTMSSLETEAAAIGTAVRLGIQHGILEMCIFSECKDAVEIFNREQEGPAQVEAILSHWREESNLRHFTVYNCDWKYVTKADSLAKCAAREGKLVRWDRREDNFPDDVGSALMDCNPSLPLPTHDFSGSDVYAWKAHILEVTACAWSPTDSLLASGSADESVLIWKVSDDLFSSRSSHPSSDDLIVLHGQNGSISRLAWNGEGELLAIGSYDGKVLLRSKNGELKREIDMYGKALFCVAWNRKGDFLLTGSYDRVIVTDTNTWECKLDYETHPVLLGAEWRNNISFATYSMKKRIYVYDVSKSQPVKMFSGHQGGINAIKWDYSGTLLASCSDDGAVKIWTMEQDQSLHNLMHNEGVDSIRWSPNPNKHSMLASASADHTIKLWDGNLGQVLYCFNGHRESVIEIEFSPDGEYLASGAEDGSLLIWKVKDGTIVKSFMRNDTEDAVVENISWNGGGNKLAAGFGDGVLWVIGSSKPILQCNDRLDDLVNDFLAKS